MNITIRKATDQDEDALKTLLFGFYITQKKELSQKTQQLEAYKDNDAVIQQTATSYLTDLKHIVYIAFVDEKAAGYICGDVQTKSHKVFDTRGYVQDWFVLPEFRDKKIGKHLFDRLTDDFRKAGCTIVALDTFAEDQTAIDRYRHMGFRDWCLSFTKEL
jgi:ribosomal protein S18 acetylase RimI-like enzyme